MAGTESSNLFRSTGESAANLISSIMLEWLVRDTHINLPSELGHRSGRRPGLAVCGTVAAMFAVSPSFVVKLTQARRRRGTVAARPQGGDRRSTAIEIGCCRWWSRRLT